MKVLRSILLFALLAIAGSGLFAAPAFAITSLTQSQVNNVCGPDLVTGNGHSGCVKKCYHSSSTCIYDCSAKTGECNGATVGLVSTPPGGPKWPNSLLTHPAAVEAQGGNGGHHGPGPGTGPTIPVDPDPAPVIY